MNLLVFLTLFGAAFSQWDPNFAPGRAGIVHLFEWHWDTIADECETSLGPNLWAGVQVSPPNENRVIDGRPWWERYQPVSYIVGTRSGDRASFQNMIDRCNAVGVRIYVDAVINHMCRGATGTGTAGSYYDVGARQYDAVPYSAPDFNDGNCKTSSGNIENYQFPDQVRNCQLQKLPDLNQGKGYVRGKIIDFMNDMILMGVAGFRVDACKHMWPGDLDAIFSSLDDLSTDKGYDAGLRPFIFQEVIDQGGESITANEYYNIGRVTEFKYGLNIGNNKNKIQHLRNFGEAWGMMPNVNAVVFLNNHDNQRGHGGGGNIITFHEYYDLKIFTAFMMAWPYGIPRVMSSYEFTNTDAGPPELQRSVNDDGTCGNGWVCEHRWRQIKNMAAFAAAAQGQPVSNWWDSHNQIAFSRGSKAFIAINKAGNTMSGPFATGMPSGDYCDVIHGEFSTNGCTGSCISVDGSGNANINISPSEDPFIAIHVNAPCNCPSEGCNIAAPPNGGQFCASCNSCTKKVDCGVLKTTKSECEGRGCMWCPAAPGSSDPWCIYRTSSSSNGSPSCSVNDSSKRDCGFLGVDQAGCEAKGCCWAESTSAGIPWCFQRG